MKTNHLFEIYMDTQAELAKSTGELQTIINDDNDEAPASAGRLKAVAMLKFDSLACEKAGREWRASVTPDRKPRTEKPSAVKSSMP